jgi:hypothetical protein
MRSQPNPPQQSVLATHTCPAGEQAHCEFTQLPLAQSGGPMQPASIGSRQYP